MPDNQYIKVKKSALLSVLVLVGALQQTKTDDEIVIEKLQGQLDDLKNEDNGLDDPEINSQLDRVAANAAAQPHDTVVARNDQDVPKAEPETPEGSSESGTDQNPGGTQGGETGAGAKTGDSNQSPQ